MKIRGYQPAGAEPLLDLFRDAIRRVNARDYTPAQIAAWSSDSIDLRERANRFAGRFVAVAEDEGRPIGFAELDPADGDMTGSTYPPTSRARA